MAHCEGLSLEQSCQSVLVVHVFFACFSFRVFSSIQKFAPFSYHTASVNLCSAKFAVPLCVILNVSAPKMTFQEPSTFMPKITACAEMVSLLFDVFQSMRTGQCKVLV